MTVRELRHMLFEIEEQDEEITIEELQVRMAEYEKILNKDCEK